MSYFALAKAPRAVSRRAALLKGVALASGVGMAGCAVTVPTHIRPITGFDITKYTGTWYENARIDHWFEKAWSTPAPSTTFRLMARCRW